MDTSTEAVYAPPVRAPSRYDATTSTAPEGKRAGHLPGLDGIRGIAVTLVLLYHFFIYHRAYAAADPVWLRPIARLFNIGSSMGWTGVELFFVLSGFLIT